MLYTILYYWGLGCITLLGTLIIVTLLFLLLMFATETTHVVVKLWRDAKEPPQ